MIALLRSEVTLLNLFFFRYRTVFLAISLILSVICLLISGILGRDTVAGALLYGAQQLLMLPLLMRIFCKIFKLQGNRAYGLLAAALILEIGLNTVRSFLNGGSTIVLFLPLCLPLAFLILVHHSDEFRGKDGVRTAYVIGFILLAISLFLEMASFFTW